MTDREDVSLCVIRTYVFTPHGVRPLNLSDKFRSIEANLNDVVEQSEGGSQWEGGHEKRHKPVLDYWNTYTQVSVF